MNRKNRESGYPVIRLSGIPRIAFLILLLVLCTTLSACSQKEDVKLETVKVTRGNISAQISTTGIVVPRNRLGIKPPVAGRVEKVLVVEGQNVRKGQILAWMSSSDRATLLDAARAKGEEEVKHWEDVYKPAPIIAPLSGFIIKRSMEPGQFFNTSENVLVMADKLIVQAQVDETDIGQIKLGQKAIIILDAYPDKRISAFVEHIAYESETTNNVTVYKVNILPISVPAYFRSGMSATTNFSLSERQNALILPLSAVKKKGKRSFAFVQKDGKVSAIKIEAGLEDNDNVEIISGLNENDEVVIPTAKILQETLQNNSFRQPINIFGKKKK